MKVIAKQWEEQLEKNLQDNSEDIHRTETIFETLKNCLSISLTDMEHELSTV